MLKSIIATILALLAATFGMRHAPATAPAPVAQSARTSSAQLSAVATITAETSPTTTPHFQDLSNAGTPAPTGIQSSSSNAGTSANGANSNPSAPPPVRTINATLTAQLANPFLGYATKGDIASATAALDAKFQSQLTALASAVSAPASGLSAPITVQAFAPSQRINNLSNITVSGVAGLTASDIPALNYLSASGGTLSGALINSSTASSTFAGAVGIGTTSPISELDLENWTVTNGDCSNADCSTGNPQVSVSGTLNTSLTLPGHVTGFQGIWQTVGATSSTSNINGMRLQLDAGYTGSGITRVADFQNYVQGGHSLGIADVHGNIGATIESQGGATNDSTVGDNIGVYAIGNGSKNVNIAVYGRSFDQAPTNGGYSIANIGVIGVAAHNYLGPASTEIGGFFAAGGGGTWYNNLATSSTALLLDNEAENVPILIGRVNGVNAFQITSTGGIFDQPSADATNLWQVQSASGTTFFDLDSANGRAGIGTTTPWGKLSVSSVNSSAPEFVVGSSTATTFFVSNSGNVGIGTTTPNANLVVSNPATTASFSIQSAGDSVGSGNVRLQMQNGDGNSYQWQYSGSGNTILRLQYNSSTHDVFNTDGSLAVGKNGSTQTGSMFEVDGAIYIASSTFPNSMNQIALYGGTGGFNGLISLIAPETWTLGYGTTGDLITLATPALTWNSSGNVGIGTTTPYSRLEVFGPDTASTSAFAVVNSASTTVFAVFDSGNSTYSGSIFQSSDQRLKTNVQSLDGSASLSAIEALNPVSYLRLDQPGTGENLGFIAQQVQSIFPQLVSTSSATALTPGGTLTLNYEGLIAPIVKAIQGIASISGDFEINLIAWLGNARNGIQDLFAKNLYATRQLCIDKSDGTPVCITGDQLATMLTATGQTDGTPRQGNAGGGSSASATSTPDSPPVIQINGNNPATINVGDTYNDLGATITGPQPDLNLGLTTYLNGTLADPLIVDTTQPATDTVQYVATDQNGLTATSTRTVLIESEALTVISTTTSP